MLDHAVLPALTIVLASIAGWIIGMRNMMITTMDEDYVLLAQAKGLPRRRVIGYAAQRAAAERVGLRVVLMASATGVVGRPAK